MLVTVQFPIADLRPFVSVPTHRLLNPSWPTPRPGTDFIRHLGQVCDRRRGGVTEWSGEHIFCSAAHAVRFLPGFSAAQIDGTRRRYGRFRRFFSDGLGHARMEVGVGFGGTRPWTLQALLAALHDAASLPVLIRPRNAAKQPVKLLTAGRALAQLVLDATTSKKVGRTFKPRTWWMAPCEPLMLVEYSVESEAVPLPPEFRVLGHEKLRQADLAYGRMSFFGRPTGVWLNGGRQGTDPDFRHRLRIHLLRLHAQREVVKEVLRSIQTGQIAIVKTTKDDLDEHPSNRLQRFLHDTIARMDRKEYSGLPQSELLQAVEEIQDTVTEGERTAILQRLQPLRKVVLTAVERFTNITGSVDSLIVVEPGGEFTMAKNTQNVNINAPVTGNVTVNQLVARQITNALNTVQQSAAPDELKQRLVELTQLVDKLVQKAPPEVQEKAAKNLEALTKEAVSAKPDRAWYDVSAKGLMEAAQAVADMAAPITTAVKAVLALLV